MRMSIVSVVSLSLDAVVAPRSPAREQRETSSVPWDGARRVYGVPEEQQAKGESGLDIYLANWNLNLVFVDMYLILMDRIEVYARVFGFNHEHIWLFLLDFSIGLHFYYKINSADKNMKTIIISL